MKLVVYAIAFVFSLFAVYSHFIMDNWHLPFIFLVVSFMAFINFRLSTLTYVIKNRVFVCLIGFYDFYVFNLTFSFEDLDMDSWSLKNMRIEFISIFLLITAISNISIHKYLGKLHYTITVIFGLIHGFGFSGYLKMLLGNEENIFTPLLSFNLGLEFGQIIFSSIIVKPGGFVMISLAGK